MGAQLPHALLMLIFEKTAHSLVLCTTNGQNPAQRVFCPESRFFKIEAQKKVTASIYSISKSRYARLSPGINF